ncbi:MAG: hypothetical protein IPH95_21065 [Candidatus Promineofilum sp.]|nr:hypothetical protein [Promineifilum sp.]
MRLHFEDGAIGEVNVPELIEFRGVFAALPERLSSVQGRVDPAATVVWPGGGPIGVPLSRPCGHVAVGRGWAA